MITFLCHVSAIVFKFVLFKYLTLSFSLSFFLFLFIFFLQFDIIVFGISHWGILFSKKISLQINFLRIQTLQHIFKTYYKKIAGRQFMKNYSIFLIYGKQNSFCFFSPRSICLLHNRWLQKFRWSYDRPTVTAEVPATLRCSNGDCRLSKSLSKLDWWHLG